MMQAFMCTTHIGLGFKEDNLNLTTLIAKWIYNLHIQNLPRLLQDTYDAK